MAFVGVHYNRSLRMYKVKRFSYSVVVGGGGGRVDIKF